MKKATIKEHLQNFNDIFEYHEEDEKTKREAFYSFKLDSIKNDNPYYRAISDVLQNLETDMDTRYKQSAYCIDNILENYKDGDTIEDIEELEFAELADSNIDVYTSGLTEWLNKSNFNVYYLTTALENSDVKDGFQALSLAQYYCHEEIYNNIKDAIVKFLKEAE